MNGGLGAGAKDVMGAGAVNVPFGLGAGAKDVMGAGAVNVPFGLRALMVHTNFKP